MTINKNLVPASKYNLKCPNPMEAIGICVHNTANDASAKGEISYMVGNNLQTSFHFAVDDIEVWQGLPLDRNGWHAGDGSNGAGNRNHIGIEICYSKSGGEKFAKAENNAAELIAQLLKERNWGIERVKKHQDFSGKYCPHRTLDLGWDRFLNIIKSKMGSAPTPPGNGGTMPMTDADLRQKVVDNLKKYKDVLDMGDDKHKLAELMNDPDMINRIFAEMARSTQAKAKEISEFPAKLEVAKKEAKKAGYDEGFAAGQASAPSNPGSGNDFEIVKIPGFKATGRKLTKMIDPQTALETSYGVEAQQ